MLTREIATEIEVRRILFSLTVHVTLSV